MPGPRLIHLIDAAKSFGRPDAAPRVVLLPGTISLPTDRRLVVLAERKAGKTTLLQLLGGAEKPDRGAVLGADTLSPVVNATGLMHPALSAADNLRFLARAYGFDADGLLAATEALAGTDMRLDQPLKSQDGAARRDFEAAAAFVIPFGCYLVDEAGLLDRDLLERCLALAEGRGSGVVLSTSQPRLAAQHAEAVAILREGVLRLFADPLEGVQAFEDARRP